MKKELPAALGPYKAFILKYTSFNQAFRNAALQGELEILRALRPFAQIDSVAVKSKATALHAACANNHINIILWLLEQGARLDIPDEQKRLPLDLAKPKTLTKIGHTIPRKQQKAFKQGDTIVINAYNTNGIGDAVHAVRAHLLCRRLMPNIERKSIICMDKKSLQPFLKSLNGDVASSEIAIFNTDPGFKNYDDKKAAQAEFVIFSICDLHKENGTAKFQVYYFIDTSAPQLKSFLQRSRVYLNFATKLCDGRNVPRLGKLVLEGKGNIFSFLELGGPKNREMLSEASLKDVESLKEIFTEREMGLFNGDAGMMIDEQLHDLMHCLTAQQLQPCDFTNPLLYNKIVMQKGLFAVGYMQHLSMLRLAIATLASKSADVRILSNTQLITNSMLNYAPFNQFSQIKIFDDKGELVSTHTNANTQFGTLCLFPFTGLSNQDKRRYILMAECTLGSGDNSFLECITAGKPFIWDIPSYKISFVSKLGIYLANHGMPNLAKLLYLNIFLSQKYGLVTAKYLIAYQNFFKENWDNIVKETQLFHLTVIKKANFSDQLATVLLAPKDKTHSFITNSVNSYSLDKDVCEIETPEMRKVREVLASQNLSEAAAAPLLAMAKKKLSGDDEDRETELTALALADTLSDALLTNESKVLEKHFNGIHKKYAAELSHDIFNAMEIFRLDDVNKLHAWLDQHPFIELTENCIITKECSLVEYAVSQQAMKCLEILVKLHQARGEEDFIHSIVANGLTK